MRLRLPVLFVGLLVAVAAYAAINQRILGLFHDDGIYAVTARHWPTATVIASSACLAIQPRQNTHSFIPRSYP